jgi:tRNA threonylcarbamoyladenosine biosynthesis protein TsaB
VQCGGPVCALIDARRKEVYCGVYRLAGETLEALLPERVAAPQAALEKIPEACLYVGSGARLYRQEILAAKGEGARLAPSFQQHPDAAVVAWLADKRLPTEGVAAADLRPIYLRKSDAQIHRETVTRAKAGGAGD